MGGDKASSLEDLKNEAVDLERIPIEEVFEQLKCTKEGLTSEEGANRIQIFGQNKLEEKKESKVLKFLGFMWNPLSWVMEMAAIMAIALANGGGKPPDWEDFVGIVILLVINSTISFIEENNAGNAAAALMARLAPKTKVLRDGTWSEQDAAILDAIDAAMVGMLADPKEARAGIREVHFFPFNPVDKRTALTYVDEDGKWHRVSKGAPEQIMNLCNCKEDVRKRVHTVIDKFAERGLRSLAVARQEVPERSKESHGGAWQFVGLLPLFDPPRHDSAETIRKALNLGVNVKMITGDQLAIAKETGRRLGMGTNMYPSSSLLGQHKDDTLAALPVDELIEKADGFAGVFPEHKAIFQRMKNYTIYAVSITIRIVLGFMLIALIWKFDFSPFMVLIIAILNDGTIMTISKDRVKPSPMPDSWKLKEIFATGVVLGTYLALMTVFFFWAMKETDFFSDKFHVRSLRERDHEMMAALYLQVSIISQALIFVTRSRSWSFLERPGLLLCAAFVIAQLVATLIAVYADWGFAKIKGCGWGWAGIIWLYSFITFVPLDWIKFAIRYILSGKAWDSLFERKTAFTTKKDYGREEREAQWATAQRTLHGLQPPETTNLFSDKSSYREFSEIAEQAKRRAGIARLREPKQKNMSPRNHYKQFGLADASEYIGAHVLVKKG
ncbi:hypothetical protein OPV22_024310 [Ensete ventricosum]|uniref:P-type H(+)-exporting transporter n=1 Tax=Ensete ventricosum TaxID=4639 RepID=A0AAV8QYV7_ENSVE|nr:hypothetical protein OPV22_024310 [Ensete ventricosum]